MKKFILTILVFGIFTITPAAIINQVIVSVGDIAITSYDIQQMQDFEGKLVPTRPTANEALEKLISMAALLVVAESSSEYYMSEAELRNNIAATTNNPSDPSSEQRKKLYEDHSEIYRMTLRADKVKRGMIFTDLNVKSEINTPISLQESQKFYNQNRALFKDAPYPKFDLIVFAVEISPKWSLSELTTVEEQMQQLANDLNTSSDYNKLRRKYSSLKFTSFSGRTGLFDPEILMTQKKIPNEVLGISHQPVLDLGPIKIPMKKNTGIFIPQPIPFQSTGISTYLTLKIIEIIEPTQLSFDESLPKIEEMIKFQRGEAAVQKSIKKRITDGQITLTPSSNAYNNVLKKFR
ncbi:MAG: hypothetical protein ACRCWI_03595 [Brevinema sp.]